jgi:hypothetical protein
MVSLEQAHLPADRAVLKQPEIARSRGNHMIRRFTFALACALGLGATLSTDTAEAQQGYGRQWGSSYTTQDWNRFYHYPYVYYPQNFWGDEYYRSSDSLYYRYPAEMRTPVYNTRWHNEFPEGRAWHSGHHFILDQF